MKRLSVLFAILVCSTAFAESKKADPSVALVERVLVEPLAAKERDQSRFSRARMPAGERRVRILDAKPRRDASGASFVRFAIDERRGFYEPGDDTGWNEAAITGCAYAGKGDVFIEKKGELRPAAFLLGKNVKRAAEHVCQGPPSEVAQKI
jgi:hypothetical protein